MALGQQLVIYALLAPIPQDMNQDPVWLALRELFQPAPGLMFLITAFLVWLVLMHLSWEQQAVTIVPRERFRQHLLPTRR